MAQVTTTTLADALAPPGANNVARDPVTGYLYVVVQTATATLTAYVSTNGGTSWGPVGNFTHTGLAEWSGLVVESYTAHIAYRVSTGTTDTIWYRRLNQLGGGGWSAGLQTSGNDSNGGTAGATWQGVDLAAVKNSNGSWAIVVAGARTQGTSRYGVQVMGVSITAPDSGSQAGTGSNVGTIYANNAIINGTRAWWASGTAPGRSGVVVETEHNGNGQYGSPPNVWISWGRQRVEMVKLSWIGQASGWNGPTSSSVTRSSVPTSQDYVAAKWDGTQFLQAIPSPDDSTKIRVYQRNKANTVYTSIDSPAHPAGVIRFIALSYDNTTKNPRLYAIGTSNSQIYWVDYTRATSTWGSWLTVNGATVLGPAEFGTRKGGSSGTARHDIVYGVSGSPNTIQHVQQVAANTLPTATTWDYSITPPNGRAADVGSTLPLAWTFTDPDPTQTQGAYALRRQIGAGTAAWWNASTSTWGASEVFNASTTQGVTLPTAWGADSDAVHNYAVRVQDSAGGNALAYSDVLALTPSAKVNPTVSAPTNAQVITTDTVTVTWTVAEQTAWRIQIIDTTGGGSVIVYDSGKQVSVTTSVAVPYSLSNGSSYTVNVWTYNNEGLISAPVARTITVSYATPPPAVPTMTPVAASGWMTVTGASLAPSGVQPAISSQNLYRRPRITAANLLANGTFAGSVTGFTGQGGTLSYSTAQSYSTPGSARLVPTGAAADSLIVSSTVVTIPASALAGGLMTVGAFVRPDTVNKSIRVQINWLDASNAVLSSVSTTVAAAGAGTWQYVEFSASPLGVSGAARASAAVGLTGTPAATDALYADDITLREGNTNVGSLAAQLLAPQATYNDWGAPGVTDLEYRWQVRGANGTVAYGPWVG